jgi:isoaspartyl peptidase/L-asparaginase-like protein (Ntn-hydrolase superfamily)
MDTFKRAILTHGGACSDPQNADGPLSAAQLGMDLLANGKSALAAVVAAVKNLEDDPRFNAGTGSQVRTDGRTVQMDAACMMSNGAFGGVACVEGMQNPIEMAQGVLLYSSHILIAGVGVDIFAKEQNIPIKYIRDGGERKTTVNDAIPTCDTVGAVAFDGTGFAAALSSGGLKQAAIGRIGDVPLPGCGLFCGSAGAVACTGDGEFIALKILAKEVYGWLERKMSPAEAAQQAITLFDDSVDTGLIILTKNEFAGNARSGMAWAQLTEIY